VRIRGLPRVSASARASCSGVILALEASHDGDAWHVHRLVPDPDLAPALGRAPDATDRLPVVEYGVVIGRGLAGNDGRQSRNVS
jgi:hypothetical protein